MWWIGDWWAYGEHAYGDRKELVEDEAWTGPKFQTCANAALVCKAFETSRRREVLSYTAHLETAVLPPAWQDEVLDWAVRNGCTTREIRDEVKQKRAFLAQGWTPDQLDRKARAEAGECVVASLREVDGRQVDAAL